MRLAAALVLFALAALLFGSPVWSADRTVAVSGYGEIQAEPDRALAAFAAEPDVADDAWAEFEA